MIFFMLPRYCLRILIDTDVANRILLELLFTGLVNNILNEEYVANGYFGSFDFEDNTSPTGVTTGFFSGFYPQATTNFLVGVTLNF